jgi:LuxR family quorum sensing-dependent transcriptional regulator
MDRAGFMYSCIEALERAKTATAVMTELARATRFFGLDHCIVAGIPAPFKKLEPFVLGHNWPSGWYERYNSLDYLHVDPVIRKLRSSVMPVVWKEAPYDQSSDKTGHAVMMEAREFRLNNGLSVPIYSLSGDQSAVSFGGAHFDLSAEDKKALHMIAIYGHFRAYQLRHPESSDAKRRTALSPRELEILKWTAAGLHSHEIAERLCIGYETVETHIRRACIKLDVATRIQAVAEAIRSRLIP